MKNQKFPSWENQIYNNVIALCSVLEMTQCSMTSTCALWVKTSSSSVWSASCVFYRWTSCLFDAQVSPVKTVLFRCPLSTCTQAMECLLR